MQRVILLLIAIAAIQIMHGQGVGINQTGADPNPSAGLDVDFNNRGFLPPRLTTEQRDGIQNPAEGLHIYNLSTKCVEVFYGTFWQSIHCGCSIAPSDLVYTDNGPIAYCLNQGIALNSPTTQGGNPSAYTVSPPLPTGLFLNTTTGQLSGSPSFETEASAYTFTASNACGSTTRTIIMGVSVAPSTLSLISGPSTPTLNTTAIYSVEAVLGSPSYTWTVPNDWTINSGQGSTTINVAVGTNSGTISVTASNACGSVSAPAKSVSAWRPVVATGGIVTNYTANGSNGVNGVQYRVHSFTTVGSSSLNVTEAGTDGLVDYLVLGGGGGGGGANGGGGGGGGYLEGSAVVSVASLNIVVGNGGQGGTPSTSYTANPGGNSVFGSFTAIGGGAGATFGNTGQNGGSGGGGAGSNGSIQAGGNGTLNQGNMGGTGNPSASSSAGQRPSGGGGGAGQAGGNAVAPFTCGAGGIGLASSITGTSQMRGGGGGGGSDRSTSSIAGAGGNGGGGAGGQTTGSSGQAGFSGTGNTGGGGGGGNAGVSGGEGDGGNGGSGIVIIRYPTTNPNP